MISKCRCCCCHCDSRATTAHAIHSVDLVCYEPLCPCLLPTLVPGLPPSFEVTADLQVIDTMAGFIRTQIRARGLINRPGAPFFQTCISSDKQSLKYEAPHGCYQLMEGPPAEEGDEPTEAFESFPFAAPLLRTVASSLCVSL